MKRLNGKALRLWSVFVTALAIVAGSTGAGALTAHADGPEVPFYASYAGTAVFGSAGAPLFSGTGLATELGRSTSAGYSVFTAAPAPCAGGVPNDQYETLTAADGDAFTIVSHDVACPEGPYQYHGTGHWEVVAGSGTGRFAQVSGQGTLDGHSDFYRGVFTLHLTGTLTLH